jgi:sorting nexin-8
LFKGKYGCYVIVTPLKGYSVERRYSDFLALRQEMIREYPEYIIPPIPAKKLSGNVDPEFIQERKVELQKFLTEALIHPLLKNYDLLMKFISLSSKDWEERAKMIGKVVIPREIGQHETIEGEARILYSDAANDYCEKLNLAAKDLKESFKELRVINKTIAADFDKLSYSTTKAAIMYQKISSIYSNLNCGKNAELFLHMCDGYSRLGEACKVIKDEFAAYFGEFFSFYGNEMQAVEELIGRRKVIGENMESAEKKLFKKKEQRFEQKNTATWELGPSALANLNSLLTNKVLAFQEMFPKESEEAKRLRMAYGYFTNKIVQDFDRVQKKNEGPFKKNFIEAAEVLILKIEKVKQIWSDMMTRIKGVDIIIEITPPKETELTSIPVASEPL